MGKPGNTCIRGSAGCPVQLIPGCSSLSFQALPKLAGLGRPRLCSRCGVGNVQLTCARFALARQTVAGGEGFEPSSSGFGDRHSGQLSYPPSVCSCREMRRAALPAVPGAALDQVLLVLYPVAAASPMASLSGSAMHGRTDPWLCPADLYTVVLRLRLPWLSRVVVPNENRPPGVPGGGSWLSGLRLALSRNHRFVHGVFAPSSGRAAVPVVLAD